MSETTGYIKLQNKQKKQKYAILKIIFIIFATIVLFTLERILKDFLSELSANIMLKFSEFEMCSILSSFQFFEFHGRFLLIFLLLNFTNTFAALMFILVDVLGIFINGNLKLIYQEPRPYWTNQNLIPCFCASNFGNPSTTGLNQFLMFAFTYKIITTFHKNLNKVFIGLICCFPVFLICFSRFFQHAHSLNQLLFGCGIGLIVYYILFNIIELNCKSKKQFDYFIKNFFLISILIITIFLIANIFHVLMNVNDNQEWLSVITKYCEYVSFSFFDRESYSKSAKLFFFLGAFLGVYLEYKILFKNNKDLFIKYNMDKRLKFNNTSNMINTIRIFISFLLFVFVNYFILKFVHLMVDMKNDSLLYLIIMRSIIPVFIQGFLCIFIIKNIFRFSNLTNEKVFEIDYVTNGICQGNSTDDERSEDSYMNFKINLTEKLNS